MSERKTFIPEYGGKPPERFREGGRTSRVGPLLCSMISIICMIAVTMNLLNPSYGSGYIVMYAIGVAIPFSLVSLIYQLRSGSFSNHNGSARLSFRVMLLSWIVAIIAFWMFQVRKT